MSETRRIVQSDDAACPRCGFDEAIVRVNGNAFAATCVRCRSTSIAPMLLGRELLDAWGENELVVQPVAIARAINVQHAQRRLDEIRAERDAFVVSLRLPTS